LRRGFAVDAVASGSAAGLKYPQDVQGYYTNCGLECGWLRMIAGTNAYLRFLAVLKALL
jgi:hypothetical protein